MKFFAPKNLILIFGDIGIAFMSVYAGTYLRLFSMGNPDVLLEQYVPLYPRAIAFSVFIVVMCFFTDLYNGEKRESWKEIFLKIIVADLFASFVLGAFYYFVPEIQLGRGILFLSVNACILSQAIWHMGNDLLLKLPMAAKRVLILGTGPIASTMGKILSTSNNGFALSGYVNCIGETVSVPSEYVVGNGDGLLDIALRERAQQIVVSLSERRGTFPVREVLNCKLQGIEIIDGPSFYEQLTGKLLIENMNPSHLIFSDGFRITMFSRYLKRMLDVVFASIGIILSLPILIIIPILIKLDSRGPVLFKQKRVGEGEKTFILYKFRSMVDGAEKESGPVWSKSGDSRITRVGRLLRKTRLDEIPQLFNVMFGTMSFIGPRPERAFFVESLRKQIPYYSERHCLKPGITGWAQVRYQYGDSMEDSIEKLRYDLYYIKYQSLSLDLLIVLDTIKVILSGRGGR